jgi:hypothetical protein
MCDDLSKKNVWWIDAHQPAAACVHWIDRFPFPCNGKGLHCSLLVSTGRGGRYGWAQSMRCMYCTAHGCMLVLLLVGIGKMHGNISMVDSNKLDVLVPTYSSYDLFQEIKPLIGWILIRLIYVVPNYKTCKYAHHVLLLFFCKWTEVNGEGKKRWKRQIYMLSQQKRKYVRTTFPFWFALCAWIMMEWRAGS